MFVRLASFYASVMSALGVYMPFWPLWLADHGRSKSEVAVLTAVTTFVRILVAPTVAHYADRHGERRRYIRWLCVASLASFALFGFSASFVAMLAISLLWGACFSAIIPLTDNLTMLIASRESLDYGRMRVFGSITFSCFALLGGSLLEGGPTVVIFVLMLVTLAAGSTAAVWLPDVRTEPMRATDHAPWRQLLARPGFVTLMLGTGLVHASHAVLTVFGSIHWAEVGISKTLIGMLWTAGVVTEICLFIWNRRLVGALRPINVILLGGIAAVVRWTVLGATDDFWLLLPAQALHGLTYGATHLGALRFINEHLPAELSASAQGLYSATGMGILFGSLMLASGPLYKELAGSAYFVMTAVAIVAVALQLRLRRMALALNR